MNFYWNFTIPLIVLLLPTVVQAQKVTCSDALHNCQQIQKSLEVQLETARNNMANYSQDLEVQNEMLQGCLRSAEDVQSSLQSEVDNTHENLTRCSSDLDLKKDSLLNCLSSMSSINDTQKSTKSKLKLTEERLTNCSTEVEFYKGAFEECLSSVNDSQVQCASAAYDHQKYYQELETKLQDQCALQIQEAQNGEVNKCNSVKDDLKHDVQARDSTIKGLQDQNKEKSGQVEQLSALKLDQEQEIKGLKIRVSKCTKNAERMQDFLRLHNFTASSFTICDELLQSPKLFAVALTENPLIGLIMVLPSGILLVILVVACTRCCCRRRCCKREAKPKTPFPPRSEPEVPYWPRELVMQTGLATLGRTREVHQNSTFSNPNSLSSTIRKPRRHAPPPPAMNKLAPNASGSTPPKPKAVTNPFLPEQTSSTPEITGIENESVRLTEFPGNGDQSLDQAIMLARAEKALKESKNQS